MNHVEKAILDMIEKYYHARYTGGIKVTKIGNSEVDYTGYKLVLNMGNYDVGMILIIADIKEEKDFLEFVKQELISRLLIKAQYFEGIKYDPEDFRGRAYMQDKCSNKRTGCGEESYQESLQLL